MAALRCVLHHHQCFVHLYLLLKRLYRDCMWEHCLVLSKKWDLQGLTGAHNLWHHDNALDHLQCGNAKVARWRITYELPHLLLSLVLVMLNLSLVQRQLALFHEDLVN